MAIIAGGAGAVAMPLTVQPVVLTLGVMIGFVHFARQASTSTPDRRTDRVRAGTVTAASVAILYVAVGVVVLLGPAALGLTVLVAAGVVGRRLAAGRRRVPVADTPDDPVVPTHLVDRCRDDTTPDTAPSPETLTSLSIAELCQAWRISYGTVAAADTTALLDLAAAIRRSYLDELERRNPHGFRRWIDAGARAAGDPYRYLNDTAASRGGVPHHE